MLKHAPEPTTSTAAASGRPCGLHPTASHTGGMVARVLVGRAELFQTRAVTGWEDGEEDGRPGRRSPTLNFHHVAFDGGTDQPR